jgi:CRP/FNR family transcriptional regulator, cyclic AMP receptor protein
VKITPDEETYYLKKVTLFQNLKPLELKIISLCMEHVIFKTGDIIVSEGDEGDEAFIIYSGRVEVYRKLADETFASLNVLGPGEMFGEMALFGDGFRTASVKAIQETIVGVITKEKLYDIVREFPDIAIEILKVQTRRFSKMENRLMECLKNGK